VNEQAVVQGLVGEVNTALPTLVTVRSEGGDGSGAPPLAVVEWDTFRINENGANPYAGVNRDQSGTAVERELHRYYRMEAQVMVRALAEADRDTWLAALGDHFSLFEYESDRFHPDTFEWEVGDASPRSIQVVEPDWYEGELELVFKYVKRSTDSDDALGTISEGVYVDETL